MKQYELNIVLPKTSHLHMVFAHQNGYKWI